ncbi:hypothetical protein ACR0ST_12470 [Aliidiomarina sp. Khilg15.8]
MKKSNLLILILAAAAVVSYVALQKSDEARYATSQEASSPTFEAENAASEPETTENTPTSDDSISSVEESEEAQGSNDVGEDASDASIGEFLTQNDDSNTLATTQLSELSVNELRRAIANLDYDENKNNLAFETEYTLEQKLNEIPAAMSDTVRCSDSICGLLFSGDDKASIMNTLEQLSDDESVLSISGGGFLRHLEEHGSHYGMLVVIIDNDLPLSIK